MPRVASRRPDVLILAVVALLAVVYAPVLGPRYYMRDEFMLVQDVPPSVSDIGFVAFTLGWKNARPLAYPFYGVYSFTEARGGLFWIRVSQIAMSLAAALGFHSILRRRGASPAWAAALVLFLWSQPCFVIYDAYCPMAPYWLGIGGAWLAFLLVCGARAPDRPGVGRLVAAALLLFAGWMTFQAAPFCALALLAWFALTTPGGRWAVERARYVRFAVVWVATLGLYVVATKAMLAVSHVNLTPPVRRAFDLLSGTGLQEYAKLFEPTNLLSPFEWWNYLLPVAAIPDGTYLVLTGLSAVLWLATLAVAFTIERRDGTRGDTVSRYAVALAAVGVAYLPVALEGLKGLHRQHVAIAVVPALALTFAYAARAIAPFVAIRRIVARVAVAVLLLVALGARASLERGIVQPHAAAQAFVEDEVRRGATDAVERLVIVNAQETDCRVEPCRGLYGRTSWSVSRHDYPKLFRRIAREILGRPGLPVEYLEPEDPRLQKLSGALLVDYRRFDQHDR